MCVERKASGATKKYSRQPISNSKATIIEKRRMNGIRIASGAHDEKDAMV